ncbi:DUF1269 domain-containing protein [Paraburkholderia phenazinium]|uniref:DUF1269 domain-containing protein n=1 Tax=Paraburkholderia phenazinium TaxID=60549 RepID=UPI00158CBE8E|nr:DUF1269 domain-containing protein [Paraburkholderia phenazinium]
MNPYDIVIATFDDHIKANAAVHKLIDGGFNMKNFSVVGKGYHTEEKIIGFYNVGDRMKLWGKYGAFWGGIWGLMFGGVFLALPVIGPVVVLGHLAVLIVAAIEGLVEGAVVVGALSALGAALFNYGVPKDSVIKYEAAVKADGFLVVGHGPADEMARARAVLQGSDAKSLDMHYAVSQVKVTDLVGTAAT